MNKTRNYLLSSLSIVLILTQAGCSSNNHKESTPDPVESAESQNINTEVNKNESAEKTITFDSGITYSGQWENSGLNGQGVCTYPGVGSYQGEYSESKRNGTGTFTWDNGDELTGTWKDDLIQDGIYTFADGSYYNGSFNDDGNPKDGVFSYGKQDNSEIIDYSIYYKDGSISTLIYSNSSGYSYQGSYGESGNATITYPAGDTYTGDVKYGNREGTGTYTWKDSDARYVGQWSENEMAGYGVYYYSSTSTPSLAGNFVNGSPDGTLTYTKEDGTTFSVQYSNGNFISVQ